MATLRVFYFGLIAHVDADEDQKKEYAAIVKDNGHVPFFLTQTDPHLPFPDTFRYISPAIRRITCAAGQPAGFDRLFERYVPPLRKILGGDLASNVKDKIVEVQYPGSQNEPAVLSVAQLYPKCGLYVNSDIGVAVEMCVSRITVVTVSTSAPSITFQAFNAGNQLQWTEEIMLDSDKCVLIGNPPATLWSAVFEVAQQRFGMHDGVRHADEEHPHPQVADQRPHVVHHGGPHASIFGEILDGDSADHLRVTETDDCDEPLAYSPCTWLAPLFASVIEMMSGDNVECGTTGWP
jgi:hypothetical protein